MTKKILIVDDEPKIRDLVRTYLEKEGYQIVIAGNGREALYVARHEKPDLIILDVMMPEMDGYEFMRNYQKEGQAPIIMLTAKVEREDLVVGLEMGADDYIEKPFHARELIARVRAVLRRVDQWRGGKTEVIRIGEIALDRDGRLVEVDGTAIELTPSEFDILSALMDAPGRVFSRLDLLEHTMGNAYEGYERTIDVHVRNLRTKIEQDPATPQYVQTVYGMGYRFAKGGQK
jgi:DNA-binding response OmpR family regulator